MLSTGSCLCGDVKYEVEGPLRPVVYCHCEQCRKTSGHHVAASSAPRDKVKISGELRWYRSSNTARRGFCPTCGGNLFWDGPGGNMSIMAGTLDDTNDLPAMGHIFVADKAGYVEICDGLPQAAQDDATITTKVL
ncbi:MAG: GFA family protein [Rhodobacteraceae bacterium]|nr:GFA family protein [Paracoccaceae bacterium]